MGKELETLQQQNRAANIVIKDTESVGMAISEDNIISAGVARFSKYNTINGEKQIVEFASISTRNVLIENPKEEKKIKFLKPKPVVKPGKSTPGKSASSAESANKTKTPKGKLRQRNGHRNNEKIDYKKYKNEEAYLSEAQQLRRRHKIGRKWAEKAQKKLQENYSQIRADHIPYSIVMEANHEAIYKYWMDDLTEKHQQEIQHLKNKAQILVSPSGRRTGKNSQLSPRINKTEKLEQTEKRLPPQKLLMNRPTTSIEIRNMFSAIANTELKQKST
ncbi:hypothetical protein JTB14_018944 [Gonioctena quinquepunctata]|nr:hypothetical protein JTB14_018944 [Gonioctena quinquepunctata]